jgi:hypothetical protein
MTTPIKKVRDQKPETSGLTWRFVARTLPTVFAVYFGGIGVVHGLFLLLPDSADRFQMVAFLAVLVPLSVGFLYPFMRRHLGSSAALDKREATWTSSHELASLAGRQSARYLSAAFPVEILAMAAASFAVTALFKAVGLE